MGYKYFDTPEKRAAALVLEIEITTLEALISHARYVSDDLNQEFFHVCDPTKPGGQLDIELLFPKMRIAADLLEETLYRMDEVMRRIGAPEAVG